MLLAAVGTYGVMACAVGQRTNEIGIRMALGAQRSHILAMVLKQGLVLVAGGIGAGLVVAFSTARLIRELLCDVAPTDAKTYVAVSLLLAAGAFLACYIPARRAMRTYPMEALRYVWIRLGRVFGPTRCSAVVRASVLESVGAEHPR
jgi:ABC-type antimicrobial peptide transport system permease subunit